MELNLPQMMVQMIQANEMWLLWARGTGKTVGGIAPTMSRLATAMPGHLSGVFGQSFAHLDSNIMPKLLLGLQQCGYVKDQHYVAGVKPPKEWPPCLYPIKKWDRTITWHNGTVFHQVSLHEKGSANAYDFQSGIFDEIKLLDPKQLEDEVMPTFRGFEHLFGHLPEYLAKIFATDKLGDYAAVKWILDKRKLMDREKVDTVLRLQLHLNDLLFQYNDESTSEYERRKIWGTMRKIQARLNLLRKDLVYVSEANAMDNIKQLGPKWLADKQKSMGEYEFKVAIMNEDPMMSSQSFYPGLSGANVYEAHDGTDYRPDRPIFLTFDYQHSITPISVIQPHQLPWENKPSINFINEFYVLHPQGIEEAIDKFCLHYFTHQNKVINYVYDHTAIGERPSAQPVKDIVVQHFRKKGWAVVEHYTGAPPQHYMKYERMKTWMEGPEAQTRLIRFNKARCPKTMISMAGAGTVIKGGKTQKEKKFELVSRYPKLDQSETTHFSDCVDMALWYFFGLNNMGTQANPVPIPGTR